MICTWYSMQELTPVLIIRYIHHPHLLSPYTIITQDLNFVYRVAHPPCWVLFFISLLLGNQLCPFFFPATLEIIFFLLASSFAAVTLYLTTVDILLSLCNNQNPVKVVRFGRCRQGSTIFKMDISRNWYHCGYKPTPILADNQGAVPLADAHLPTQQ